MFPISNSIQESKEFYTSIVGKELGEGGHRTVYEYLPNTKFVIKIAKENSLYGKHAGITANILENYVWGNLLGKDTTYFAPIHWLSNNGRYLIQSRAKPLPKKDFEFELPRLPDMKPENLGLIKNKLVIVDYGDIDLYRPFMEMATYQYYNGRITRIKSKELSHE